MSTASRKLLTVALLGGLCAGAMAQSAPLDRAQVGAGTAAAVAAGQIPRGELSLADLLPTQGAGPVRPRASVRAEALAAEKSGQIPHGEADYAVAPFVSTRTRADVRAETRAAIRQHLIPHGEGTPQGWS